VRSGNAPYIFTQIDLFRFYYFPRRALSNSKRDGSICGKHESFRDREELESFSPLPEMITRTRSLFINFNYFNNEI
jgi:hypothetical protein